MAEPIRFSIFARNGVPFLYGRLHLRKALPDEVSCEAYDVVEMVEVTTPKTCATCKIRVRESEYDEHRDQYVSWHECKHHSSEEFDDKVNDGTGFCHRHEEKQDG